MKRSRMIIAFLLSFSLATQLYAAQPSPVEMAADTIEYESATGLMVAQGNIKLTKDKMVMTGTNAEYNSKTKEARIFGNVKAVQEQATLTAAEIRAYDNSRFVATGDVVAINGDKKLTGPVVEYFSDREYGIVPHDGTLITADGTMTADKLEAFFKEDQAIGDGHVHIVSDVRKLDAVSDHAVYYGAKTGANKVILTGNAHAVQDGNTLTGNSLTLYLDDKAMDSQGRSQLVIKPQ